MRETRSARSLYIVYVHCCDLLWVRWETKDLRKDRRTTCDLNQDSDVLLGSQFDLFQTVVWFRIFPRGCFYEGCVAIGSHARLRSTVMTQPSNGHVNGGVGCVCPAEHHHHKGHDQVSLGPFSHLESHARPYSSTDWPCH